VATETTFFSWHYQAMKHKQSIICYRCSVCPFRSLFVRQFMHELAECNNASTWHCRLHDIYIFLVSSYFWNRSDWFTPYTSALCKTETCAWQSNNPSETADSWIGWLRRW